MESNNLNEKNGKKSVWLIVVILGVLLIAGGILFAVFVPDMFKEKNTGDNQEEKSNDENKLTGIVEKFEGIYATENDKIYIHKNDDNNFEYMISGNFQGKAKIIDEKSAQGEDIFSKGEYFEFKLVDGGIDVSYHTDNNVSVTVDTGIYNKVADYSKDNIYKETVGDPSYLNSKYSGLYSNDEFKMYVIQTSENELKVELKENDNTFGLFFSEIFELQNDNKFVSYSFFDDNEVDYEIEFNDKEFKIIVHDDVFGVNEDDKKFESTYKFENAITQDEILNEFYELY